jgi:parvulin-like peptidyl-prolyl isomerase
MASSLRKLLPLLLLALIVFTVAACGSSDDTKTVPPGAVALVGDKPIEKADLDRLLAQAKTNYEAQKQDFPEVGTPDYQNLRGSLLRGLVQQAQWEQAGAAMGVKVSDQEVDTRLAALKQQYFKGDEEKYKTALEQQGLTEESLRDQMRAKLLSDKLYKAITDKVKVTDADIKAYYDSHEAQFMQPESREVQHILVKTKSLADEIYAKLKNGADFAALAKKYSQDPGSKTQGGQLTIAKGQTVPEFDKVAFALKTGATAKPVRTQYGWHIIQALKPATPAKKTPLAQVKESIRQQLLQQKRTQAIRTWLNGVKREYESKVTYATGLAPATTSTPTTTG